jgi:hypothetical protein
MPLMLVTNRRKGSRWQRKREQVQGLLLCGCCDRRLTVRYTDNGGIYPRYQCNWLRRESLGTSKECLNIRCDLLDAAVAEGVLKALQPAEDAGSAGISHWLGATAALIALGVSPRAAANTADSGHGPWYLSRSQALSVRLSEAYFHSLGLPSLIDER